MFQGKTLSVTVDANHRVPPLAVATYLKRVMQDGTTPLHLAAYSGIEEAVHLLVRNGAKLDAQKSNGRTPLFEAATACNYDAARELLRYGANRGE